MRVVFLYPPADVVNEGRMEDSWRVHNWFSWPGNQFEPERQERTFTEKIRQMADTLGIKVEFAPQAIYQEAKVNEFIAAAKDARLDAAAPTAIVYHSVGSNHQLPPKVLREATGLYYIHSIENWEEIERGLRAARAAKMLAQSRLLRVSGRVAKMAQVCEKRLETEIVSVPAEEFNALVDAIQPDDAMRREALQFKKQAAQVMDVADESFVEAFRAHQAVGRILERYAADAVTIECLFLKHRKPCVSFALRNGGLVPCGCENHLDATLTMMLGRWLIERAGFQHNPEFDTSENRYFGAHCTCALKLHGPQAESQK